jgi:hypothetical protein
MGSWRTGPAQRCPLGLRSCSIHGKATLAATGRRLSKTRCDPFCASSIPVLLHRPSKRFISPES